MKKCPYCKTTLPDEAVYCLSCSSVLNDRQAYSSVKENTKIKKSNILITKKTLATIVTCTLATIIVLSSCFFAIKSIKSNSPNLKETPQTAIVPVTEEDGEIATNEVGEQIYEVTEITETTTKKSILDIIFDKEPDADSKDNNTEDTTENNQENLGNSNASSSNTDESDTTEVKTTIINNISIETTTNNSTTTTKSTTSNTTTTTNPSTPPNSPSAKDFDYTEVNGEIKITKYTGSSSTVTVPAYIDGKRVAFLGENAFSGNSNIKTIVFQGTTTGSGKLYLPTKRVVFNNLPNLTSITFPYETHFRMTDDAKKPGNDTFYDLIINCPKLSAILFSGKDGSGFNSDFLRMYSIDGVVLAQQNSNTTGATSTIVYYPPAKTTSAYTVPSQVYGIVDNAIIDNPYLKSVHFHSDVSYVASNFLGCKNLAKFTVDSGNPKLFAKDDVLYTNAVTINGISYKTFYYPPAKTDASFTFTDKYNLSMDEHSFCGNPYLKTATFYNQVYIYSSIQTGAGKPAALSKIRLDAAYSHKIQTNSSANFIIEYY